MCFLVGTLVGVIMPVRRAPPLFSGFVKIVLAVGGARR